MFSSSTAATAAVIVDIFAIISLLQVNKKIEAIKEYRKMVEKKLGYDPGIGACKDFVEDLAKMLPQYTKNGSFIYPNNSSEVLSAMLSGYHINVTCINGDAHTLVIKNIERVSNNRVYLYDSFNAKYEIIMG